MPGAEEITYRDNPWFNVGSKTFALGQAGLTILKLEKPHQEFLFEVRPDTFRKFTFGPNVWSYVELDRLDEAELTALVREAWALVVPKKVSKAFFSREAGEGD